jgi:hypothetical protein
MLDNYRTALGGDECRRTSICSQQLFSSSFELQVYFIEIQRFLDRNVVMEARVRTFRSLANDEVAILSTDESKVSGEHEPYEQLFEATPGSGMFALELQGMMASCTMSREHSDIVCL